MAVTLPHIIVKKFRQPADEGNQALNADSAIQSPPVEAAEVFNDGRRPSSRGGGISAAAATAVAQIRRRRTMAHAHALQPHNTPSAATVLAANRAVAAVPAASAAAPASDPASADPTAPSSSHVHNHGAHAQPDPATITAADLSAAAPQQSDTSHAAHSQPAEVTDQAGAGTSRGRQPLDRTLSVSRPPLPYHAIRRSARLHKAADTADAAPVDASQPGAGDQADVQCGAGRPLRDAHMATNTCGPCTRYALWFFS